MRCPCTAHRKRRISAGPRRLRCRGKGHHGLRSQTPGRSRSRRDRRFRKRSFGSNSSPRQNPSLTAGIIDSSDSHEPTSPNSAATTQPSRRRPMRCRSHHETPAIRTTRERPRSSSSGIGRKRFQPLRNAWARRARRRPAQPVVTPTARADTRSPGEGRRGGGSSLSSGGLCTFERRRYETQPQVLPVRRRLTATRGRLRLNPDFHSVNFAESQATKARILCALSRHKEAAEALRSILLISPDLTWARVELAQNLYKMGLLDDAARNRSIWRYEVPAGRRASRLQSRGRFS